jgi:hypothetical protein
MRSTTLSAALLFLLVFSPARLTMAAGLAAQNTPVVEGPTARESTVFITEVMSSNTGSSFDLSGSTPDWIEIHNYGDRPVDLTGFGIGDDPAFRFAYQFDGVTIAPGQSIRLWAIGWETLSHDWPPIIGYSERAPTVDTITGSGEIYLPFRVSSDGETVALSHPDGTILDLVDVPPLPPDVSFGRLSADPQNMAILADPTPGRFEAQYERESDVPAAQPVFSHEPGFYIEEFSLSLGSPEAGAAIYYTLDGSDPDESSHRYDGSIRIIDRSTEPDRVALIDDTSYPFRLPLARLFKGTVVRAVAYVTGRPRSQVSTGTWFVTPEGAERYSMPVISLVADGDDLFGHDRGIYVLGRIFEQWRSTHRAAPVQGDTPANYNQRGRFWAIPASVELFDGDEVIGASARIRTLGGWTRANPVKSLRIDFDSPLEHRVFPHLDIDSFHSLVLRTSGNDWESTLFRDAFMTSLMDDLLEVQASRPAIVFLNGEYWGIHNIRERQTPEYFESHFGVPADQVVVLENDGEVAEGELRNGNSYVAMINYLNRHDLSDPDNLARVESIIDIDDYIDYMAAQIYIGNMDWPGNNVRFWQDTATESRWRWLLYDTDLGFGLWDPFGGAYADTFGSVLEENGPEWPNPPWSTLLFRSLFENEEFRNRFLVRFCDFLNSRFHPDVLIPQIDSFAALYRPEMQEHISRWAFAPSNIEAWEAEVDVVQDFARHRPTGILRLMARHPLAGGYSQLTIETSEGGSVRLNSLEGIRGVWRGKYIRSTTLSAVAVPDEGYRFAGWSGASTSTSADIEFSLESDASLVARFEGDQ